MNALPMPEELVRCFSCKIWYRRMEVGISKAAFALLGRNYQGFYIHWCTPRHRCTLIISNFDLHRNKAKLRRISMALMPLTSVAYVVNTVELKKNLVKEQQFCAWSCDQCITTKVRFCR